MPLDGFFEGAFQTGMAADEILVGAAPPAAAGRRDRRLSAARTAGLGLLDRRRGRRRREGRRRSDQPRPGRPDRGAATIRTGHGGGGGPRRDDRHGRGRRGGGAARDRGRRGQLATSTPTAPTAARWPSCTRDARSRRRSAGNGWRPDTGTACASNGSRLVDARPRASSGPCWPATCAIGDAHWSKGRRLTADDLEALATKSLPVVDPVTVLVLEPGDMHEDDAASALAEAVAGPGLRRRGPVQSRIDLLAEHDGVVHVRTTTWSG